MSVFTEETCALCGCLSISVSPFLLRPTRHLFVPDSIKLGRGCSSDVYSVPITIAEIILMTVYAIDVNRWSSH